MDTLYTILPDTLYTFSLDKDPYISVELILLILSLLGNAFLGISVYISEKNKKIEEAYINYITSVMST